MSDIPYHFTAIPNYFIKTGWTKDPIMCQILIYLFSRIRYEPHTEFINGREIHLEPFEFIFGRDSFCKETGISPREVRTRLGQIATSKKAIKVTSKTTSKYTVYKWTTKHFMEKGDQQNDQQDDQQNDQRNDQQATSRATTKKNETIERKNTKETFVTPPFNKREGDAAMPRATIESFGIVERLSLLSEFRYKIRGQWKDAALAENDINVWSALTKHNPDELVYAIKYYQQQEKQAIAKSRTFTNPPGYITDIIVRRLWDKKEDKNQNNKEKIA